jgi:predicted GNAT superfamily acetyltransferase
MKHCLIDKTILNVKIAEDKKALLFITNEGEIIAKAEGDCCSETWIENIEVPAKGFPAKVHSVNAACLRNEQHKYRTIAFYGFNIYTDRGEINIDYRNASNGYYGGNLSWPDSHYYGGVYGQNISNEEWKELLNEPST